MMVEDQSEGRCPKMRIQLSACTARLAVAAGTCPDPDHAKSWIV